MAFARGKDGQVFITNAAGTSVEISTFVTSFETSFESEVLDTTTIGGTAYKSSIRGFLGYSGSINGNYDDAATSTPDKYFIDLITAASTVTSTAKFFPAGSASGKRFEQAAVYFQNYKKSIPVDNIVTWSVDYQLASSSVTQGTV
jgi:hypothetical protein